MSLYKINTRSKGYTTFVSVTSKRGNVAATSSEKVIPPVIEYQEDGSFIVYGASQILKSLKFHPYKANSKDFNEERLADLAVASFFKQLEHFPTLATEYTVEGNVTHPVAELIYMHMVYLKPSEALAEKLEAMDFISRSEAQSAILEKVSEGLIQKHNIRIDLFSIPKRKVGTFAYLADTEGYAHLAKVFGFGLHKIIPNDRAVREISSLKNCEKFLQPDTTGLVYPKALDGYVSKLRIAVVGTKESMLDGCDLYTSALPKIACKLSRKRIEKDVAKVPESDRNLVYKPFRSGIEVFHQEEISVDERDSTPGTIRLIFPSGVKVAAQPIDNQLVDGEGNPIDALMEFDTFAKKGALACFLYNDPNASRYSLEEAQAAFLKLTKETVYLDDVSYEGYIVELPVLRPGQRYTELSKGAPVSVDLIAKAILAQDYVVRPKVQESYRDLVVFREALMNEIAATE